MNDEITGHDADAYFAWHTRGELRIQRCRACGRWIHTPQVSCPGCQGSDLGWERVSGRGTVFTWTVTHRSLSPAYAAACPYISVVVQTEEGPRVLSVLLGTDPDAVSPGMQVEVAFEPDPAGVQRAVFRAAEQGQSAAADSSAIRSP